MSMTEVLRRKTKLRKRLLRVEHHSKFLNACGQDGLVPKGLKINTQVHPARGVEPSKTAQKIDFIVKKAVTHY